MGENKPARVTVFFDGQNLYHCAKEAFGHTVPLYSPIKLAHFAADKLGGTLCETRFYTGIPKMEYDPE